MITFANYEGEVRKEKLRHKEALKSLERELKAFQNICKHESRPIFWLDASGNNGSWHQCPDCGKEV